jgi:hypothetical protein
MTNRGRPDEWHAAEPRVARTINDVARLAPLPGLYRLRHPSGGNGEIFYRGVGVDRLGSKTWWWVLALNPGTTADDSFAVGMEIIGPKPAEECGAEASDAD